MRIAIFGGTFDPVHRAHLAVAHEAVARCGVDRVMFVPAAYPPHKLAGTAAPYADRLRMVELGCAGEAAFEASDIESGTEKSYSIRTIERLKARHPDVDWAFLIGTDAFAEITSWYRWQDVVAAVTFIVVTRPGHEFTAPEGARVVRLDSVALPVSSSQIRRELAAGEAPDVVPGAVLEYIRGRGLYQGAAAAK
jgi:nicotinate-nucleotide adenylyltransferase